MSFKHFFQFSDSGKKKSSKATVPAADIPRVKSDLCDLFREGIQLKDEPRQKLQEDFDKGVKFFHEFNEARIELAFESFDLPMRYALYEIIYLLHVNDSKLSEWTYKPFSVDRKKEDSEESVINLYVEGAPAGVKAIDAISPIFNSDFQAYILETFGERVIPSQNPDAPIEGIYSIGSIGTVGHKNIASDLDLEIQFNLEPSVFDTSAWDDDLLKTTLNHELNTLIKRYYQKKGIRPNQDNFAEIKKKATLFFKKRLEQKYPILYHHIVAKTKDIAKEIRKTENQKLRYHLILEIINLMKRHAQAAISKGLPDQEELLIKRVNIIQHYIQHKFPEAEIYLFPFSRQNLQKGSFGSTLDSKESSGGAYELILNYETLMPGIYFTPVIPSHFVFDQDINNNSKKFNNFSDFLQFNLLDFAQEYTYKINHQGATPDLDKLYIAKHYSAAYWEAFKASSGNLPKATLNIIRYEMLLEDRLGKTIIQLIKNPSKLDKLVPKVEEDEFEEYEDTAPNQFTPMAAIELEAEFPNLKYDPWWIRYKALKVAFYEPGRINGINPDDLFRYSRTIDFAFALHIRLSDVFTKAGDQRVFKKHREKVLRKFLNMAFPKDSEDRVKLNATFIGDVNTVSEFENQLKDLFLTSVDRIKSKVKAIDIQIDEQSSKEFEIWNHYYEQSFRPKSNVVQRCILNHLQVPRGRLQLGYIPKKGWFFKSLQKGLTVGKRFESSIISLLPEEIMLVNDSGFLNGLVYCVINRYYGIFNQGTLAETKTEVEFDRKFTNIGTKFDNQLAFVRPDQIERIMRQILSLFDTKKVDYMDCIRTERSINEVMIFLNLLKYGSLSILYRDSLNTIYVDQMDIPKYAQHAEEYMVAYQKMITARSLHVILNQFFRTRNINIRQVNLKTWVNPNSVETTHAATKYELKETELAEQFFNIIMKIHGRSSKKKKTPPIGS